MIHKEPTMSTEHKTDVKDVLDKFDSQGKSSSVESLQQLFNNSPQDQMLFEGLANADQHLLDLSLYTWLQHHQMDQVSYSLMAQMLQWTRER